MKGSANKSSFSDSKDFTLGEGDEKLFSLKNKMRYLKVALLKEREGRDYSLKKSEKLKNALDELIHSIEQEVLSEIMERTNNHLTSVKNSTVYDRNSTWKWETRKTK